MSQHRTSVEDPATTPGLTTEQAPEPANRRSTQWPMRAVVAVGVIGGLAAAAAGVVVSAGGTEPVVDGLVLLGFATG